jgi:uncharacterized membrane protein
MCYAANNVMIQTDSGGSHMNTIIFIAIGAVAVVLVLGLVNMLRGGSANTSQTLMRWRVGLQFAAIVIVMTIFFFRHGG